MGDSRFKRVLRAALYWTLYAFSAPGVVLSLLILTILWVCRLGTRPAHVGLGYFHSFKREQAVHRFRDFLRRIPGIKRLVRRERLWGGHAMLGPGLWLKPDASDRLVRHETVHTFQLMDCYLATGAIALILRGLDAWLGIGFGWGAAAVLWPCGALVWLASYPAAGMRGERFYADAMVEQGAYALTNPIEEGMAGQSWDRILPNVKHW